jgi:hypothetical protein
VIPFRHKVRIEASPRFIVSLQEIVDEFEKALRESLERNIYDDPIPNKPTPKKPKGAA